MKKGELARLRRDLADVRDWHTYVRCPVCKHLIAEGYCCLTCRWDGTKEHMLELRAEMSKREKAS